MQRLSFFRKGLVSFLLLFSTPAFCGLDELVKSMMADFSYEKYDIGFSPLMFKELPKQELTVLGAGAEGKVFSIKNAYGVCYKKWHKKKSPKFAAASLVYVKNEIDEYSWLRSSLSVPLVYAVGPDWMLRDCYEEAIPLNEIKETDDFYLRYETMLKDIKAKLEGPHDHKEEAFLQFPQKKIEE